MRHNGLPPPSPRMHMLKKPETYDGNRNRGVDMRFYVAPHIVADEVRLKLKDKASQMEKKEAV